MKVKMVTKEIEKDMAKYPLYSQDGKGDSAHVIFKAFNPYGGQSWYILEASDELPDGDRELFAYVTFGYGEEGEYGYLRLSDLTNTRVRVWCYDMPLERDRGFRGTLADAKRDAGIY